MNIVQSRISMNIVQPRISMNIVQSRISLCKTGMILSPGDNSEAKRAGMKTLQRKYQVSLLALSQHSAEIIETFYVTSVPQGPLYGPTLQV